MFQIDKKGNSKRHEDQDEIDNLEDIVFNRHQIKKLKSQNYVKLNADEEEDLNCFQIDKAGDQDNLNIEAANSNKKQANSNSVWEDDDDEIG